MRPKESHGTTRKSGQLSFKASINPAAVPTSSHRVAHAKLLEGDADGGGIGGSGGLSVGSWVRRCTVWFSFGNAQRGTCSASFPNPSDRGFGKNPSVERRIRDVNLPSH